MSSMGNFEDQNGYTIISLPPAKNPSNHRSESPTSSDVTTIDENEIAAEIEVQKPMAERWAENDYATVVRQHSPMSKYSETNPDKLDVYVSGDQLPVREIMAKLASQNSVENSKCCYYCEKIAYPLESVHVIGRIYHKNCFKCQKCLRILSLGKYSVWEGNPYCEPHYFELFKVHGHYDGTKLISSNEDSVSDITNKSASPIKNDFERPSPNVTQTLVAKFRDLEKNGVQNPSNLQSSQYFPNQLSTTNNHNQFGLLPNSNDIFPSVGTARELVEHWNKAPFKIRTDHISDPDGKGILNGSFTVRNKEILTTNYLSEKNIASQSPTRSSSTIKTDEDISVTATESEDNIRINDSYSKSNDSNNEFPTPGITKNMVAKFSALFAT